MIKRITHVKDFRCYQNWRPHDNVNVFARLNLVYAPNGTGKSTFAELLSGVPKDKQWSHGMKAVIQPGDDPKKTDTIDGPGHWIWDNVRLFNAEYVRRNLRFDANDDETTGPDAPALLYLGELEVEQKERRDAAQAEIERLTPELKSLRKKRRSVESKREKLCTDLGGRVAKQLSAVSSRFPRHFNKSHVKKALEQPLTPWRNLEDTFGQDRTLLGGASQERISPVSSTELSLDGLCSEVGALVTRTVTSEVIGTLRDRSRHEFWVREGLELHEGLDTCLFCEGELDDDRRRRLEHHFDEGYTRLLADLDRALAKTGLLREQASRFSHDLPRRTEFFEDLRGDYEQTAKRVASSIDTFQNGLEGLADLLRRKKGAMFTPLDPPPSAIERVAVDTAEMNQIIEEHNQRTQTLEADREQAAEREFQRMLRDLVGPYRDYQNEEGSLAKEISDLSEELKGHQAVLREGPQKERDPEYFLSKLNGDIRSLLRRSDLTFEYRDDRYQVLRHDQPARHLSEGEKTAIALIYFLQSLREKEGDLSRSIVVVDDPVSSLDEQLMFGIYSMLIGNLDPEGGMCRQLFVLTHNTSFLRHWNKDLKSNNHSVTFHLMRSVGDSSGAGRSPSLIPVDPKNSRESVILETEYLLVFHNVAHNLLDALDDTSVGADLRLLTSAANDARKVLEHFLQFKAPKQATDLTGAIRHVLKSNPVLAKRLTSFVHGSSHRDADMASKPILDLAARDTLSDVLTLIRDVDRDHFEGMCHRLDITDRMDRLTSP